MSKETAFTRPIAVDLFAGAGGMSFGFEQAGFDVLAAVEIDPVHACTYQFNFPDWTIFCRDVAEITGQEIRNFSAIKEREIDVVFGGSPCQGFSIIGKRNLSDPRNYLIFHFVRLILELQPKFFVIENVKGMASKKYRNFILEVVAKLRVNNYKINDHYRVLNAANYGVPQHRERLFLIGCRSDLALPKYPRSITNLARRNLSNNVTKLPDAPTVEAAIKDLPKVENYPELFAQDWVVADFGEASDYGRKLRGIVKAKDDYSYLRQFNPQILTSSWRTKHTQACIDRFAATPPGTREPISRFHKLASDGICNTLRAGTDSSRGSFTAPRPIHPQIPRCITVREAARLHSYPDWFRFQVTKWHGFRQIGNSVPPLLAKAIASEIVKVLEILPDQPTAIKELGDASLLQFTERKAAQYWDIR